MKLQHDDLSRRTAAIFQAAGCQRAEAERIAVHLVEANLVGHDSHGVIRVASYVKWLRAGKVLAGRTIQVAFENEALAVVDGQFGFGQTVGAQAVQLGIDKSGRHGVAVIALRNAGHMGYGLAVLCEVLAGALTGGGCSNPAHADRLANGMLSIYLDPARFQSDAAFAAEVQRLIAWVKSSEKATPDGDILMPGEIEERTKAQRLRDGIDLDATTWAQILDTAKAVGLGPEQVHALLERAG